MRMSAPRRRRGGSAASARRLRRLDERAVETFGPTQVSMPEKRAPRNKESDRMAREIAGDAHGIEMKDASEAGHAIHTNHMGTRF